MKLGTNKLTIYESNIKLVAVMLIMGVGGGEIKNLLAFLDLPHGKSLNISSIPSVERELGNFLREAATIKMKVAMEEE
eukprot:1908477-Ditylum_brightwellii.AAC.1